MHKPRERANEEGVRELNVAQPKEKKKNGGKEAGSRGNRRVTIARRTRLGLVLSRERVKGAEEKPCVKSLPVCLQRAPWWRVSLPASWDFGASCADADIGHGPRWPDTPGTSAEVSDPGTRSRAPSAESTSADRITLSSTSSIFTADRSRNSPPPRWL